MAKYRQIHLTFWHDPFIEELSPMEKYFYIYLMTNSRTTQCGCYEISMRLIKYETGLSQSQIDGYIKTLVNGKKIAYNEITHEFLILNWLKHNSFKSPKVKACIIGELSGIKDSSFKDYISSILEGGYSIDSLSIGYNDSMDSGSQKEKEKEEKKEEASKKNVDLFFEECWELYPRKEGKGSVSDTKKKELFLLGDEFKRCIQRYSKAKSGLDKQYTKHGSTFFNSGYIDYLDENYEAAKPSAQAYVKPTKGKQVVL